MSKEYHEHFTIRNVSVKECSRYWTCIITPSNGLTQHVKQDFLIFESILRKSWEGFKEILFHSKQTNKQTPKTNILEKF